MVPLLFLTACLERVTGEFVPLDDRYSLNHPEGSADGHEVDPNAGGTGDGCYIGYKGETVKLAGIVVATEKIPIQIDVNEPDADAPGGQRRACALHLPEPGPFEADVPAKLASLRLQAFQDPDVDGPSDNDPFAQTEVLIGGVAPAPLELLLIVGARGSGGSPGGGTPASPGTPPPEGAPTGEGTEGSVVPAPPGAPGGPPVEGGAATGTPSPPPPGADAFPEGPRIRLSGTINATSSAVVSLDFFRNDGVGQGGRTFLFKLPTPPGAWSQAIPVGYGPVVIEAFQDLTSDGPTPDDIRADKAVEVSVGAEDIPALDFTLK